MMTNVILFLLFLSTPLEGDEGHAKAIDNFAALIQPLSVPSKPCRNLKNWTTQMISEVTGIRNPKVTFRYGKYEENDIQKYCFQSLEEQKQQDENIFVTWKYRFST